MKITAEQKKQLEDNGVIKAIINNYESTLPELEGTPKQVALANEIRKEKLEKLNERMIKKMPAGELKNAVIGGETEINAYFEGDVDVNDINWVYAMSMQFAKIAQRKDVEFWIKAKQCRYFYMDLEDFITDLKDEMPTWDKYYLQ